MMRDKVKEFLLLVLAMCITATAIVTAFAVVWFWGQVIGMLLMGGGTCC